MYNFKGNPSIVGCDARDVIIINTSEGILFYYSSNIVNVLKHEWNAREEQAIKERLEWHDKYNNLENEFKQLKDRHLKTSQQSATIFKEKDELMHKLAQANKHIKQLQTELQIRLKKK